ncbi:MAG: PDZ domain-containing protein [Oscillospiraceae bacterium]|nr:PDZ domain-containing protein [Oscillospiraceae bacterium]
MKKFLNRTGSFIICVWLMCVAANAQSLIPGGQVIGLELGDNTVTVAAFDEELGADAQQAGLKVGDRILSVNGKTVHTAADVRYALERSEGVVELTVQRNKKSDTLRFTPAVTTDGPKLGVYLKQGVTGIGTVTWYDPDTGKFGTLGHGVNNPRGELLNMVSGNAYRACVVSVRKGACGNPGQLMGALQDAEPIGALYKNTTRGIFGTTDKGWSGTAIPLAAAKDVRTGPATIRSTVQGDTVQEYSVEILKVYPTAGATGRNILLRITDPALLEATGGIVQGMSGSPIIQDGKLIGAVTHVLVNDPTTGYGIFIENMLDAAA